VAEEPKGLGLVIVNAGKHKARVTIAAMLSGINHLIIDESLGQEIIRILNDEDLGFE
jgi:DNA-binding transcriptional regulator LsrR (DeoR family)